MSKLQTARSHSAAAINGDLFFASLTLFGAWLFWPSSSDAVHSGVIAVLLGVAGVSSALRGVLRMGQAYKKAKAIYEIESSASDSRQSVFLDEEARAPFRAKDLQS